MEAGNSGKDPPDLGLTFLTLNEYFWALAEEWYSDTVFFLFLNF